MKFPKYYSLRTHGNKDISRAIQSILKANGYVWYNPNVSEFKGEDINGKNSGIAFPIDTKSDGKSIYYTNFTDPDDHKIISLEDLINLFEIKKVKVTLNSRYYAEVSKANVSIFHSNGELHAEYEHARIEELSQALLGINSPSKLADSKENYLCVRTYGSKDISLAIQTILFSKGYEWSNSNGATPYYYSEENFHKNSGIAIITDSLKPNNRYKHILHSNLSGYTGNLKMLTLEEFLSLFESQEIVVKLSDSDTAIVKKEGVKVGCQTFPLTIINDLAAAVKEVSK